MKVIHIMDTLNVTGGVNSFVYDLCFAMAQNKVDVSLIGILDSVNKNNENVQKLRQCGVKVICLGAKNKLDAILHHQNHLRETIIKLSHNEPTICNLHLKLSVLLGGVSTIGLKYVKCVETYHSQYSHYWLEYTLMKRRISLYIPCSQSAGGEMQERFHVPNKKMCVIPNGIRSESIREIRPLKNDKITFLSVGRLTRQKNFPVLIDTFNSLTSHDIDYEIIGMGEDESMLKNRAKSNNIHFLGTMSRKSVLQHTAGADMICMPSLWEGLSIYMMEAFSSGRPMMLSDIPSFREAVGENSLHGELFRKCSWGYLVEVNNKEAYKKAILDFLDCRDLWTTMSYGSFQIAQRFDINETCRKYLKAYHTIL